MTAIAVAAAMLAVAGLGGSTAGGSRRLVGLRKAHHEEAAGSALPAGRSWSGWRLLIAVVVLGAGLLVVGGAMGLIVGALGAGAVSVVRSAPRAAAVDPDDVPVVIDLIAGCLAAGATLPAALDAAARAADGLMCDACLTVAAALRSGAPAGEAWQAWLADPSLAPVARTAVRTAASGAAAAAEFSRASTRLRARRRAGAQHRIRQASVWLVAPLGLCFLPAFVLVAVVPMVIGLLPTLR